VSPATLRTIRALWIEAARDARYRPHRDLAPAYIRQARQVHRQLMGLHGVRR
jgi:hypothetical protein